LGSIVESSALDYNSFSQRLGLNQCSSLDGDHAVVVEPHVAEDEELSLGGWAGPGGPEDREVLEHLAGLSRSAVGASTSSSVWITSGPRDACRRVICMWRKPGIGQTKYSFLAIY